MCVCAIVALFHVIHSARTVPLLLLSISTRAHTHAISIEQLVYILWLKLSRSFVVHWFTFYAFANPLICRTQIHYNIQDKYITQNQHFHTNNKIQGTKPSMIGTNFSIHIASSLYLSHISIKSMSFCTGLISVLAELRRTSSNGLAIRSCIVVVVVVVVCLCMFVICALWMQHMFCTTCTFYIKHKWSMGMCRLCRLWRSITFFNSEYLHISPWNGA